MFDGHSKGECDDFLTLKILEDIELRDDVVCRMLDLVSLKFCNVTIEYLQTRFGDIIIYDVVAVILEGAGTVFCFRNGVCEVKGKAFNLFFSHEKVRIELIVIVFSFFKCQDEVKVLRKCIHREFVQEKSGQELHIGGLCDIGGNNRFEVFICWQRLY